MRFMERGEAGPRIEPYYSPEEVATGQKIQELSADASVMVFVGDGDSDKISEVGQWAGSDEHPLGLVFNGSVSEKQYEHALISTRWSELSARRIELDKYQLEKSLRKNLRGIEVEKIDGGTKSTEGLVTVVEGTASRTFTKSELNRLSVSWLVVCLDNSARLRAKGEDSTMAMNYLAEKLDVPRQIETFRAKVVPAPKRRHLAAVA